MAAAAAAADRLPRWIYRIAGIYGLLAVIGGYFSEAGVARDYPPAVTHREYFYGFWGVTLAWQLAFVVISTDPRRYRPLMPVTIVEKLGFFVPAMVLWSRGQSPPPMIAGAWIDFVLAILFAVAWFRTASLQTGDRTMAAA
jgi:hypothetical protein